MSLVSCLLVVLPAHAGVLGMGQPAQTPGSGGIDKALLRRIAAWLAAEGLDDIRLRAYLDYACRDDYGAGLDTVSAWAGLHYFACRHGFDAPGEPAALGGLWANLGAATNDLPPPSGAAAEGTTSTTTLWPPTDPGSTQ